MRSTFPSLYFRQIFFSKESTFLAAHSPWEALANFCFFFDTKEHGILLPCPKQSTLAYSSEKALPKLCHTLRKRQKNTIQKRHPNQYPLTRNKFFAKQPPPISWQNELGGRKSFWFPPFFAPRCWCKHQYNKKGFSRTPFQSCVFFFFFLSMFSFFSRRILVSEVSTFFSFFAFVRIRVSANVAWFDGGGGRGRVGWGFQNMCKITSPQQQRVTGTGLAKYTFQKKVLYLVDNSVAAFEVGEKLEVFFFSLSFPCSVWQVH